MMALVPIREHVTQPFVVQTLLVMAKNQENIVELIENVVLLVNV